MKRSAMLGGLALLLVPSVLWAQAVKAGTITIEHPYARATVQGQPTGGAYLTLVNSGAGDRLVSVAGDVAKAVEMHEMTMDGDVMKMRQLSGIDLPTGRRVELKPGGLHIMLIGLKGPLQAGQSFPLTLRFDHAGEVTIDVKVEAPGATPKMPP